jgi:hypothetical protein
MRVEIKRRFARTPKNILLALGCSPSKAMLRELAEWRTWPDFPKKERCGHDIAALEKWFDANMAEIAKRKKRAKILQSEEDFTAGDLKIFRAPGTISIPADGAKPGGAADTYPEVAEGMDNLGALIMRRFAEFPSMGEVGRQRILAWKKLVGVQKREGLMPPPAPFLSNRYKVLPWFEWVARWILPDLSKNQGDLLGDNVDWGNKLKKVDFEHRELELENLRHSDDQNYILRSDHYRLCEGGNKLVSGIVTKKLEEALPKAFAAGAWMQSLPADARAAGLAALRECAIAANQDLHREIPAALNSLEEKK